MYDLGLPKDRDFEHFFYLNFVKLSLGVEIENITVVQGVIFLSLILARQHITATEEPTQIH